MLKGRYFAAAIIALGMSNPSYASDQDGLIRAIATARAALMMGATVDAMKPLAINILSEYLFVIAKGHHFDDVVIGDFVSFNAAFQRIIQSTQGVGICSHIENGASFKEECRNYLGQFPPSIVTADEISSVATTSDVAAMFIKKYKQRLDVMMSEVTK